VQVFKFYRAIGKNFAKEIVLQSRELFLFSNFDVRVSASKSLKMEEITYQRLCINKKAPTLSGLVK